ncbi:uncharacterized protein LOC119557065 [Drosophila subpulchrella]|uniref:uncharacterized protein LOC119557065 n=1 Tax=Drosophila subpulchrella TaxID=1486046 RepID=UPI0018A18540|nr:uncharacterized protein LOC119557065 [Drosophila subpulchrella]
MKKHVKTVKERKDQVFNRDCKPEVDEWKDSEGEEGEQEEEEEGDGQPEVVEEIPWEEMRREMGAMNRTLDEMQAHLAIDPYERASKADEAAAEKVGLEPEDSRWMVLHGSRDPSVRDLQLNNLRIHRQLDALLRCSELGDGRILALDRLYSRQQKDLVMCRQQHDRVLSFHLTKQLEAGKCLQRYRYARDLYASWRELFKMGRHLKEAYKKTLERTQSRLEYVEFKRRALDEITVAHEQCLGSTRHLLTRVREVELGLAPLGFSRVQSVASRHQDSQGSAVTGAGSEIHRLEEQVHPVIVMENHWQRRSFRTVRFARGELLRLPIFVPPVEKTWYGKMRFMLLNPPKAR